MDASEYRTDQEEQLDMTLNELFAIQEADVTGELLLKAGWSEIAEEPAEIFRRMKSLIRTFEKVILRRRNGKQTGFCRRYLFGDGIEETAPMGKVSTD